MNITIKRANPGQATGKKRAADPAMTESADVPVRLFRFTFDGKRNARVTADPIKEGDGEVVDYKDVTIRGYLSTWKETTPSDRDGEWVLKGAFKSSLERFMKNPVMLLDHRNDTKSIGGRFTKMIEDQHGLYVEAVIGNAPGLKDVRFHVVEGNLKTLSIGGAFRFDEDNRGIKEVELFEGSLTPVPSNPDARFEVSDLTPQAKSFIRNGGSLVGLKSICFKAEGEAAPDAPAAKSVPKPDESKEEFIPRCMSELASEYPETDQRFAVCQSYWDKGPQKE